MASANLRFRLNGGALQSGTDLTAAAEDTVSLTATSFAGWQAPAARWEILTYPDGFACPSGWSTDATTGAYYYLASSITGVTPPDFDLPSAADVTAGQWGKWRFRLTVNGTVVSDICGVEIVSPNGVHDLAYGEEAEFGGSQRSWVGPQQENLRLFDGALAGGAPIDVQYLVGSSNATLTNEVVWTSIGTTVAFASTSTIPCSFTRTSSTTNAAIDSMEVASVCSGTAANNFGVACLYKAATKDVGRIKFIFTDIGGASEDSQFIVQLRTGGSALADALLISGTTVGFPALAGAGGGLVVDASGYVTVGTSGAPADAAYLTVGAVAGLSSEVDVTAIGTSVEFASTTVLPLAVKRTDAATNTVVDVERIAALSAGTATDGFGVGQLWQAEDAAGSQADIARTYARWSTAAALTATSEWVVQLRSGGAGLANKLVLGGDGRLTVANLTLSALATGYLYASSGVVSVGAAPASGTEKFLVNDATTTLANGVPIQDLASGLAFFCDAAQPMTLTREDASNDSVLAVCSLTRNAAGGVGAIGIGTALGLYAMDDDGQEVEVGRVSSAMTSVTNGAHASTLGFWAATAGGLVQVGTWTGAGAFAATGSVTAGTGGFLGVAWDTATATSATIGATNMTALTVTPSTTFSGVLTKASAGLGATPAVGRRLRNATPATALATVQLGPWDEHEGHAWVSSADKTMMVRQRIIPRTSDNVDFVTEYSKNGGASWSELDRSTTSSANQYTQGVQANAFIAGYSGLLFESGGSSVSCGYNDGVHITSYGTGGPVLLDSATGVTIETGSSTAALTLDDSGDLAHLTWIETRGVQFSSTPVTVTHSSPGVLDLDLGLGQNREVLLQANVTSLTVSNAKRGARVAIVFTQDGGGGRTVTFSGSFGATTAMGAALNTTGSGSTSYFFLVDDGGLLIPLSAPYSWAT